MRPIATISIIFYFLYVSFNNATEQKATTITRNNNIGPYAMIKEGQSLLKEGDLVVRLNRDPVSQYIKNFNQHDKSFSHSGIVLYENGYPYVFHILNGEGSVDNKLRKDSLSCFCDPGKNITYGIFRYDINADEIKKLKDCINKWHAQGIQFDFSFNLKSDDSMYCSEMISKALAAATNKRILLKQATLTTDQAALFSAYTHLPLTYTSKLQVIPIDALYTNPFCHLIKEYNYAKR
jgi:Permuted papain-like amidase enzyme, YaeF/YiiX, C92 family